MATETVLAAADQDTRHEIALQAAYQTDALLRMLKREAAHGDGFELVLASTLTRLLELSSVVMSVHGGDDGRETGELLEVVTGDSAEVSHG